MISENMKQIFDIGFVPLIVIDNAADAVPLARALVKGGIPVAEVTYRTGAAKEAIQQMASEVPEIIVGAGTVHNIEQAQSAVEAGASFIVTPGFNPDVVKWCLKHQVDIIPGTVSTADLEQALSFGLTVCKFFPAEAYGGIQTLKALAGPYKDISFMPTGGVNANNMNDYLSLPNVAAVGGSFMAPDSLMKEKSWDAVSALCQKTLADHLGFEIAHVGINTENTAESSRLADVFCNMFSKEKKEFEGAFFAGDMIEVIKGSFLGTHGHIAINTNDIERAVTYFQRNNVAFNMSTRAVNEKGQMVSIYFAEEFGGFAVHLRRR
ncbi:MAG: bifunctional 4-hydroxy-2-oxoglutarate aldolase/2-dehydro-3-deoxy-phosphogluconate aldolase [Ruminococcus sp.]|jgi:2-dehydro-3-deoxyphosphogluconate aldolase/(4S)-4-hydroxy-2-oxoglutarate aldolase|nr:bifunctional 4-hydroxy-2-oxoglutarate aldolase/2-dehydro-3-deoxy-phosphogluconate aldolase [Ruminococcus sp.]